MNILNNRLLENRNSQETIDQINKMIEQTEGANKRKQTHTESLLKKLLSFFKRNK